MENRCQRCNRKLSDPNAQYGWRCAEILGISSEFSNIDAVTFKKITDGVMKAESLFGKSNIQFTDERRKNLYSAFAKMSLWEGIDEKKVKKAREEVYSIVNGVKTKTVSPTFCWVPPKAKDAPHTTQTWNNVLSLASSEGCTIKDATSNTTMSLGGATMKFINSSTDFSDNNNDSVVTYLDYKNAEFLFTGDIESEAEEEMVNKTLVPNVDFMSIPHHGSSGSSTKSFVTKADPEYAIVSVGENSYGHPTSDALNKYTNIGAKVYRTDKLGNIVIKTDGNNATINGNSVNIGGTITQSSKPTTTLSDIKGHWAESAIRDFVSKGYVVGYPDGTFKPNNNITRAEFVVIVNNYFGLTKSSGKVFSDTKNHWAKTSIDIAVTNGVCNGVTSTEFKPNDPITREQAATMISNYKKLSDSNHEEIYKFNDKAQISSYAKDSVEGVVERGYMSGYSDGSFKPKNKITRAEAVSTLSRVHKGAVPPVVNTPVPIEPVIPPTNNVNGLTDSSTVYVTKSGKSYHKTKDCSTLKRSTNILSMTLSQAKAQGKSDPCNICVK